MSTPTVGIHTTNPTTMPADHAALPVWNAENWFYEDFEVGHRIRSLRRTMIPTAALTPPPRRQPPCCARARSTGATAWMPPT